MVTPVHSSKLIFVQISPINNFDQISKVYFDFSRAKTETGDFQIEGMISSLPRNPFPLIMKRIWEYVISKYVSQPIRSSIQWATLGYTVDLPVGMSD